MLLLRITCAKKLHIIGEDLNIMLSCRYFVRFTLALAMTMPKSLICLLYMLNDYVKHRICKTSGNIKEQVLHEIKHSVFHVVGLQLNETTNVNCTSS